MKKITVTMTIVMTIVFILIFCFPQTIWANMAAPAHPDIGSAITFEKNDDISVLSEVLTIKVVYTQADIQVVYKMKNLTDDSVKTPVMFLSPNIYRGGIKVIVNGKETDFTTQSYKLDYSTDIKTDDWRYAVLTENDQEEYKDDKTVDAINFDMSFAPKEEYYVVVSYTYRLGGYPEYHFDVKNGVIEYYLKPAAMWKGFFDLTINLELDEDMPVIKSSNLDFQKIGKRSYQYKSDKLPGKDLKIIIDENWFQNIFSKLKSPYLSKHILTCSPLILLFLIVVIIVIGRIRKHYKSKHHIDN